ncbi:response regulator [Sporomusa aerivorans]|uniref:response regulator transcription factor n=1 Tax=Sporomusa aerivorans TaxID=204936 RepID=UPI00352AD4F3
MYKMLIADDEPAVRQYLHFIVKQYNLPFLICGEAEDGEQAVQMAAAYKPDFFILDINMPMRNGLDAAKLIREKNRDAIIYILTAYSQFEYAHQALQTQVAGYLLKPIKPAELVDTLKKGIAAALNQRMSSHRLRRMERQIEKDKAVVIKHKLFELLKSDKPNPRAAQLLRSIAKKDSFLPSAVISLSCWPAAEAPAAIGADEYIREECIGHFGGQAIITGFSDEIIMIFECWDYDLHKELQRQLEDWERAYNVTFCAGISQILRPADIGRDYKNAKRKRETGLFWQQHGLLVIDRVTEGGLEFICDSVQQQLRDCLVEREIDKAKTVTRQFFCEAKQNVGQPEHVYAACIKIANSLVDKYAEYILSTSEANSVRQSFISKLTNTTSVSDLEQCLCSLIDKLNSYVCSAEQNQAEQAVKWALEYINNNYHKDLALEQFAEKLFMSAGYFCRIFKKYAGEGYASYLTNIRLKKARERLLSGKYTVAEVARMVGFRDASYFSSVFKKHYNQSPSLLAAAVTNKVNLQAQCVK